MPVHFLLHSTLRTGALMDSCFSCDLCEFVWVENNVNHLNQPVLDLDGKAGPGSTSNGGDQGGLPADFPEFTQSILGPDAFRCQTHACYLLASTDRAQQGLSRFSAPIGPERHIVSEQVRERGRVPPLDGGLETGEQLLVLIRGGLEARSPLDQVLPGPAETIREVLHASGYAFGKTRLRCPTGTALRVRKAGPVRVEDPKAQEKQTLIELAYKHAEVLACLCPRIAQREFIAEQFLHHFPSETGLSLAGVGERPTHALDLCTAIQCGGTSLDQSLKSVLKRRFVVGTPPSANATRSGAACPSLKSSVRASRVTDPFATGCCELCSARMKPLT